MMKPCHLYIFFPSSGSFIRTLGRKSSFFVQEELKHLRKTEFNKKQKNKQQQKPNAASDRLLDLSLVPAPSS